MKRPWAALGLVLALSVIMPREGTAQDSKSTGRPSLSQNYPNPFNPETFIPFTVGGYPNCTEPTRRYKISLKILNILTDLIAVPVLVGGTGGVSGGTPLDQVPLLCGTYTAYFNGKARSNGREAASGVVLMLLEQDGVKTTRKAILAK